ncbi:MAG: hypothetical protein OXE78_14160 [Gammaproteobacteria bacterium]|nr:hypothetical protein [Gammaproteobacteria bacterium]MCY4358614.1 hypothetical protein [Gammaproteobacteria bacterium]
MSLLKSILLRNRFTILLATLSLYMLVLVMEGALTGREARVIDFENPFFDLNIRDFEDFQDSQRNEDDKDFLTDESTIL